MRKVGPFEVLSDREREESLTAALHPGRDKIWVFAYGSLIWDRTFQNLEQTPATLTGYSRSFCVWTAQARGTPELPGLGLGLLRERQSQCKGVAIAFKLPGDRKILDSVWRREMWTGIYLPTWVQAQSPEGDVTAITFVVDTRHPQYAGDLPQHDAARHIAAAQGEFGPCREYFFNTLETLERGDNEFSQLNDYVWQEINKNSTPHESG